MRHFNCKFKRHHLITVVTEDVQIKEFECKHCKQHFTTDGYGRIVKLNSFWAKNNQLFQNYFKERATIA